MAMHKKLCKRTCVAVYFCDPHSPRQWSANAKMNGWKGSTSPEGTDLSFYSQEELDTIGDSINNRPRKLWE